MARRRTPPPPEDDAPSFADSLGDVKPLPGRDRLAPPPPPPRRSPRRREDPGPEPVHFAVSRAGERLEGLAPGIDRRHLRRLRAGARPIDARIDLHGLDARAARAALRAGLEAALAEGARCVLVVHGRGLHSRAEAVLKRALPEWLGEPPLGARVLAFASAQPLDGGVGASYVLLRRDR